MWHCSSGDIQIVSCWLDPYGSCTWHSLGRGSRHLGETWPIATHSSCSLPDPERFRLRLRVTGKHCQPPAVVVGYASVPSLGFCIPGGCGSRSHPQACPLLPGFLANPHLGKGGLRHRSSGDSSAAPTRGASLSMARRGMAGFCLTWRGV